MTTLASQVPATAAGKETQKVPADFPAANSVSYRADLGAMDPAESPGCPPAIDKFAFEPAASDPRLGRFSSNCQVLGSALQAFSNSNVLEGRLRGQPRLSQICQLRGV